LDFASSVQPKNLRLIWISINIEYEGKHTRINNCILDTGSATTAIDIDLVDFNFQKFAVIKRLHGIGDGIQEVVSQKVEKFKIEQIELEDIEIEFGIIRDDFGINGFIGNDILSRFIINIDYDKRTITLKPQ